MKKIKVLTIKIVFALLTGCIIGGFIWIMVTLAVILKELLI